MAKKKQTTDTVFMVSPDHFGFNEQTAYTNPFQSQPKKNKDVVLQAIDEFEKMIIKLIDKGVNVLYTKSKKDYYTPDSVFPSSWFTTHKKQKKTTIVVYPLHTQNRRDERQLDVLKNILHRNKIPVSKVYDFSKAEQQGKALEGTGSIIFDDVYKVAYATLSQRTNKEVFNDVCKVLGYKPFMIYTASISGFPVSHTSTILSIGDQYIMICSKAIQNKQEYKNLLEEFEKTSKKIIDIDIEQARNFAGYVLEIKDTKNTPFIVMSTTVKKILNEKQIKELEKFAEIIEVKIPTIERVGGASAKAMMAEIFY